MLASRLRVIANEIFRGIEDYTVDTSWGKLDGSFEQVPYWIAYNVGGLHWPKGKKLLAYESMEEAAEALLSLYDKNNLKKEMLSEEYLELIEDDEEQKALSVYRYLK